MLERFTDRARKVLHLAKDEAERLSSDCIGTEHILIGLLLEGTGVGADILRRKFKLNVESVRTLCSKCPGNISNEPSLVPIPFTAASKRIVERAEEESRKTGDNYVGTEHILLGLALETDSVAVKMLESLSIKPEIVRKSIRDYLRSEKRIEKS
jgi:ATP-dependent Clp protease ATP-binding subunit ClpC